MSRRLAIGALLAAVVAVAIVLISGGGGKEKYLVRAVFDSGSFMVTGEQVRVAGADVGKVEAVEVSLPGEVDSYRNGRWAAVPGKAILVLDITDPAFQDFRRDASCIIRPQSLIGEKFVDCRPTLPRAPGSEPAPPLRKVPDGEPGGGQYLLPLENNSTSVDPDLINDIQSLPYAQRFRLILNELGATFAARGSDLEEVVKRANPVLRDADRLFLMLSKQNDDLARLASDSEEILRPLSRERAHVAGFLASSGAAAQASAERGAQLEASLRKFPRFLREFRLTMRSLQGFSDAAAPVFADFGKAAPAFTDATRALAPFSEASTVALKSLGSAGEVAGPIFQKTDPIVRKAGQLARSGVSPTTELAKLFVNIKKTKGWDHLVETIYNTTAAVNGFDQFGHFVRTTVLLSNCTNYELAPSSGCAAKFTGEFAPEEEEGTASVSAIERELYRRIVAGEGRRNGGTAVGAGPVAPARPRAAAAAGVAAKTGGTAPLLDYLLGP